MSDDRLFAALERLGDEELSSAGDRRIRARLETAWTSRHIARAPFGLRQLAPVLGLLILVAGVAGTALGAGADSPLWDTRVALEEAGAFLRQSNDDRVAYLLDLVASRTEEAARQDAAGHPAAAAKARAAASVAVLELDGNIPQIDATLPLVSPTPTPAVATSLPTSTPSSTPSASPTAIPTPARTVAPTPAPTDRPATPVPTPLRTATPTPAPTATKAAVTITGTVRDATGANVYGACISTSATFPTSVTVCSVKTTTNGSYVINTTSATPGQTITLYAYWLSSTGAHYSASATGTITSPTTLMPVMTLTPQK